jgi:Glycosyl hydrolases family 43
MTGGSGSRVAPSGHTVVRPRRRAVARRAGWALLAVLILAGCSQAPGGPSATPTTESIFKATSVRTGQIYSPPGRGTTKGPIGANPSLAHGLALSILSGLVSDHPIYDGDFADPSALDVSNTLYFYASSSSPSKNDHGANIPVIGLSQGAGFSGQFLGDALPKAPAWSVAGYQWGPDVWARPDKTYVMYYSTPATVPLGCLATPPAKGCVKTFRGLTNAECISRATATNPAGPFVDNSSSAFICPLDEGGAIDPSVFVASNGTPWLLWKSDGDCCDKPTYIYSQQLSPDGLSTVGPPHRLIGATQAWEGDLVEAPAMIEDHNQFWLFYSGNLWGHETYGIGIAHCASVTGPCTKPLDHAWVASDSDGVSDQGPGGEDFYQTGPIIWMVHHGLAPGQSGDSAQRRLYVDLIAFPPGELPHIAAREPAAALAAAVVYYQDPSLPHDPSAAYLRVLRLAGVSGAASNALLASSGASACSALAKDAHDQQIVATLRQRHLTTYEAYLVIILAAQYQCPSHSSEAMKVLVDALNRLPSTA